MADTGPTIRIPVDPGGLSTLMSAKKTAQEATREVKTLQRELEKAARQGKELDRGVQSQLMGARARQASAESAVASFRERAKANFRAAQMAGQGGGITRGGSQLVREARKGVSAFASGGIEGLAMDVGMDALRGAGPVAGFAMAGIVGIKLAMEFKASQDKKIKDANDLQRMAARGQVGGFFAQLANKDIQEPWKFWRDSAKTTFEASKGAAAGRPQDLGPYTSIRAMRGTGIPDSMLNPNPDAVIRAADRRKREENAAQDLQAFIESGRKARSAGLNRAWTQKDEEIVATEAIAKVAAKYGLGADWIARFGDQVKQLNERDAEGDTGYGPKNKGMFDPKQRPWRSKRRKYYDPESIGVFGQEDGGNAWDDPWQGGGQWNVPVMRNVNAHIFKASNTPGSTTNAPGQNISMGFFSGQIVHQDGMIQRQCNPLTEPLAPFRLDREQWKFGTGRGMPKTTDALGGR